MLQLSIWVLCFSEILLHNDMGWAGGILKISAAETFYNKIKC